MMPSLIIDHLSINLRSGTDNLVSEIITAIKIKINPNKTFNVKTSP